ncbi:MAG: hypothetical protein RBU23_00180 [Candidatus Auribacterota bacterium]|jgi:hypothetical protein|nr:hypothetical protein [Candidatus Auribacterota bacterium]
MKTRGFTSEQILNQLRSHKDTLFQTDASEYRWKGFSDDHLKAVQAIPANIRRRHAIIAASAVCAALAVVSLSLYVLIVGVPAPAPETVVPAVARQEVLEESDWYMESDSWEDILDPAELDMEDTLYAIPQVEQNLYIMEMQLQWLAQPQW